MPTEMWCQQVFCFSASYFSSFSSFYVPDFYIHSLVDWSNEPNRHRPVLILRQLFQIFLFCLYFSPHFEQSNEPNRHVTALSFSASYLHCLLLYSFSIFMTCLTLNEAMDQTYDCCHLFILWSVVFVFISILNCFVLFHTASHRMKQRVREAFPSLSY